MKNIFFMYFSESLIKCNKLYVRENRSAKNQDNISEDKFPIKSRIMKNSKKRENSDYVSPREAFWEYYFL